MKFCKICGEVYPSSVSTCAADNAPLSRWTQACPTPAVPRESDLGKQARTSEDERTRIDIQSAGDGAKAPSYRPNATSAAGTIERNDTPVHDDFDDHTSIMNVAGNATYADFEPGRAEGRNPEDLVIYDEEESVDPFQGMLIGHRYRLEEQIGTGAFGVVFDALDKRNNKRVAIKILSPALCNDKHALIRFRREAIAASRIQHPGIVAIDDFGIQDEGISYIVMEYLAGRDMAILIDHERIVAQKRAAALIMQCTQALSAAHAEGVLHRDLKPANIFVVHPPGSDESIKILDFGIAKDRSSNPRIADLTSASKVVGTPYYMSPEQAKGQPLDCRADIYSLGVILYELITGIRPFEGSSIYEILLAHVHSPRILPSKTRPDLRFDPELEDIVLRAIAADREQRFESMQDFSAALSAYLTPMDTFITESLRQSQLIERSVQSPFADSSAVTRQRPRAMSNARVFWWLAIPLTLAILTAIASLGSDDSRQSSPDKIPPSTHAGAAL